jgi:hypothetical protein
MFPFMSPDTVKWFSENWAALTAAPWAFITLAAIMLAGGYVFGTWFKNGEISILDRRIAEYESKLKVGSPDEAKAKIDHLEGELAGMNKVLSVTVGKQWDVLSNSEIAALAEKLRPMAQHRVQLMYLNQLGKPLAETIYEAFTRAGWTMVTLSDGGGSHLGIIAGPGSNKAGAMKDAIESSTKLKVTVDKPNKQELGDLIYLFVGIDAG